MIYIIISLIFSLGYTKMCIICGNDLPRSEIDRYQQINNRLDSLLSDEKAENLRLNSRIQELEQELYELKNFLQESGEIEEIVTPSLTIDVFKQANFFSLLHHLVNWGFSGNPFYKYDTNHETVAVRDEEVIEIVRTQAESAISKVTIEGRLEDLEVGFGSLNRVFENNGNRYVTIGFSAKYKKLLPSELNVLMKVGECAYSDSVKVESNEIYMLENNRGLHLFYHSHDMDESVTIEFTFDYYADDSGFAVAGREHAISFISKAYNTALMHEWMSFEEKKLNR